MSGDELLSTFATKVDTSRTKPGEAQPEGIENCGAFQWLRGHDRALMLALQFRNGNIIALGYAWLEEVRFMPSDGITLIFNGQKQVTITGRNLNAEVRPHIRLIDGLVRHKIAAIQECERLAYLTHEDQSTLIERIDLA